MLNRYLQKTFNKRIEPVERNGLCILQSVKEALNVHEIQTNIETMKIRLNDEIYDNLDFYKNFSVSLDVKKLEKFLNDPMKYSANETVDLFLHAISVAFKMKSTIY